MSNLSINELPAKLNEFSGNEYCIISKKVNDVWTSFKCKICYIKEFLRRIS